MVKEIYQHLTSWECRHFATNFHFASSIKMTFIKFDANVKLLWGFSKSTSRPIVGQQMLLVLINDTALKKIETDS